MSLLTALAFEPFLVNETVLETLLREPDSFEVWIVAYRDDGLRGSGTLADPYLVTNQAEFDALLSGFQPNTTVRLGPGLFETAGYADGVAGGWLPKRGFQLVGAGMDATTLRLKLASVTADKAYWVIGTSDLVTTDQVEISDLTLDANLIDPASGGPPNPDPVTYLFAPVAAGCAKVLGSHIRFSRVRAIRFGTQTTAQPGFGLVTGGGLIENPEPFDCVIEACNVERPALNNSREVTAIALLSKERASDGVMAFHRACVVRNCFINGERWSANEWALSELKKDATQNDPANKTTVVLNTRQNMAHGLNSSDSWVVVSGAMNDVVPSVQFNGSFKVTTVTGVARLTFDIPWPVSSIVDPTGDWFLGRAPSAAAAITAVSVTGAGPWTVEVTTATPHFRIPGQSVVLNGLRQGAGLHPNLNAVFKVLDLGATAPTSPTKFRFTTTTNPGSVSVDANTHIGVPIYGIVINGGYGVIVEGNRVLNVTAGVYHTRWGTQDAIIRDNHFYSVTTGIFFRLGWVSQTSDPPALSVLPSRTVASLTGNGTVTTGTTSQPHGLTERQVVGISSVFIGASPVTGATGNFEITAVPTPTQFKYSSPLNGTADTGGSVPRFGALWQVGRLILENNSIDLVETSAPAVDLPTGIRCDRQKVDLQGPDAPYVYKQVLIRGNRVRHVNDAAGPASGALGIQLQGCEAGIIEHNVIGLNHATPIQIKDSLSVRTFLNQKPSGTLIQGFDVVAASLMNELATEVDLGATLGS